MKRLSLILGFALFGLSAAQTLAEVQLVVAITAELNPTISLPHGSYRALGEGTAALIAKVPDAQRYRDWEVYAASGIVANLQPAFVQQLATSFAVSGYFMTEQSEEARGAEIHTRYLFSDGTETILLYVIRAQGELLYFVARAV